MSLVVTVKWAWQLYGRYAIVQKEDVGGTGVGIKSRGKFCCND